VDSKEPDSDRYILKNLGPQRVGAVAAGHCEAQECRVVLSHAECAQVLGNCSGIVGVSGGSGGVRAEVKRTEAREASM
jgi:hypothetical protein